MRAIAGFFTGFLLYIAARMVPYIGGCATVKRDMGMCIPPTAEAAARIFERCQEEGGDVKLCGVLASGAMGEFLTCIWKAHTSGTCGESCPFAHKDGGI